jgi:hypothetical protein
VGIVRDIRDKSASRSGGSARPATLDATGQPATVQPAAGRVAWQAAAIGRVTWQVAAVVGPALLIGALAWPLLFTNSFFTESWLDHLWFIWHQSLTIRADHLPSLFLNSASGVFYPEFAFYGGTLYALVGTLSLALGDAPLQTYILTFLLAFAAAYGGWYWIACLAGLRGWSAHAPGIVFITSAYRITSLYAIGDWPEFVAVSMIPLMVAAGLSVLRAERTRPLPALALVGSTVVFFGSHNITILWGSTALALLGLAILIWVPQARRAVTRRGALRVIALAVPALFVNAWFLLPAIAYESHTLISSQYAHELALLRGTMQIVSAKYLFAISRSVTPPKGGVDFSVSLPTLAIAWVLGSIALLPRNARGGPWPRLLLILSGLTVLLGLLMTHRELLLALPRIYNQLQFSYRLESFVLLGISGALLAALAALQGTSRYRRLWTWTLAPILVVSAILGIQQADGYRQTTSRSLALSSYLNPPLGGEELNNYIYVDLPILTDTRGRPPMVYFPPAAVHDNRVSATTHLPPGQLAYTNIAGGPNFVHVTGARIVGITPTGDNVLEITRDPGAPRASLPRSGLAARRKPVPTETISLSPTHTTPIVLGRLLSLIAIVVLFGELAVLVARSLKPSRPPIS